MTEIVDVTIIRELNDRFRQSLRGGVPPALSASSSNRPNNPNDRISKNLPFSDPP